MMETSAPAQMEIPRSRGGRPAFAEPHTTVTAYIPVSQYNRLVELANQRDQSVSAMVKQLLVFRLPK